MDVLLLTDDNDFESALPTLGLIATDVRRAPLIDAHAAHQEKTDVAIIDARANLADARNACRRLTAAMPTIPVVAVVAATDLVAVNVDWHFDDVLLTAASAAELQTRLRLAIARRRSVMEGSVQFGDLLLHPASYTASLDNRDLDLTLTEFKLLNYLVQHAGQAFTRTRLMHEVWGYDRRRRPRTVDVCVQRLRVKLGAGYQSMVDTVRGVGYMAASPPEPQWIFSERTRSPVRVPSDMRAEAAF